MENNILALLKPLDNKNIIIKITKKKFTFGRSNDCDLSYPHNKMLSNEHGYFEIDEDEKKFYLINTSRNGILINMNKKINNLNEKYELVNNDKIFLVYRASEPSKNISFQFEIVKDDEERKNKKIKLNHIDEEKKQHDENIKTNLQCASYNDNNNNDFDDTLTCSICQEIMHDCVSLQPCMHTFCAGCYSEWMEKSDLCPICRLKVDRISKNHIVNNLIVAYLKLNPNKKRSDDSIAELENKNKITNDMLYPKKNLKVKKRFEEDEEYEYSDNEENDDDDYNDDDDDDDYVPPPLPIQPQPVFGFQPLNNFNQYPQFAGIGLVQNRFNCRQCQINKIHNIKIDDKYPDYTCTLIQNHLLCQCCLEPMPDRTNEVINNSQFPRQICCVCFKAFCNLYWGCKKDGCKGCIAKYQDYTFNDNDLNKNDLINENQFETKIFFDYLKKENKSIQNIFNESIRKMKNGVFNSKIINKQFPNEKVVCRNCATKAFKEYIYVYRSEIPKNDLPDEAKNNRIDCRWGKECRTQKHNLQHAQRYNHICEKQDK